MTWIESHQELARHPKTRRLARALGVGIPATIGHLHLVWWWAMDYAPGGDLSRWDDEDIAIAAMWEGDPAAFVGALTECGFLDPERTIHDWDEYAGKLIDRRAANAERMRNARAAHNPSFKERTSGERAAHVQRTLRARVELPDRTGPNRTGTPPVSPPAGGDSAEDRPLVKPKVTIHEPPEPIPKVRGPNLAPLVDAFRAVGLPDPHFTGAEAKHAGELIRAFEPDVIAKCWQDHASGEYGDDFGRRDLSFSYLNTRQRVANWQRWREQGATHRGQPAAVRRGLPATNGAGAGGVDRFAALRQLGRTPPASHGSPPDG